MTHSFAVCAYKESKYLKDAIESLKAQTVKPNIFISTSSPTEWSKAFAKELGVPYYVGTHKSGVARDFNFAYSKAETDFVTLVHQDDVYLKGYLEAILKAINDANNPILLYSDYGEIRNGSEIYSNKILKVKRYLNSPLKSKTLRASRLIRRFSLSLGNCICTPSVCLNKKRFPDFKFIDSFEYEDWDAWERLSKEDGEFVYIPEPLILHRIHEDSETPAIVNDGTRRVGDLKMFKRFWPTPMAKILSGLYASSEKSNRL